MQPVLIDGIRTNRDGDMRLPNVAERYHLRIPVAGAADEFVLAASGIPGLFVVPADAGWIQRELHNRIHRGHIMVKTDTVGSGHTGATSVGKIEAVRIIPNILYIIHQEIVDTIIQVAVSINRMDERVDVETAHQAQIRIAEAVVVDDVCLVGDEMSEQRAGEPPFTHARATGLDIAERNLLQAELPFVAVERGSVHGEIDSQALFIFYNLGFGGFQQHVLGHARATVMDNHTQFCRDDRLYPIFSQWIVAKDIALHEVVDVQIGTRIHHNIHRIEVVGHARAREGIDKTERTAEGVLLGDDRCSHFGGDELHHNAARILSSQIRSAICARHIVIRQEIDLEEVGAIHTILVSNHKIDINILHRLAFVPVVDGKRTLKRLAGHGHLLGELNGDSGTNRSRSMVGHIILSKIIKHCHSTVIHLIRMTKSNSGSIRFCINGSIKINIVKHDAITVVCGWQITIIKISLIPIVNTIIPTSTQLANILWCNRPQG